MCTGPASDAQVDTRLNGQNLTPEKHTASATMTPQSLSLMISTSLACFAFSSSASCCFVALLDRTQHVALDCACAFILRGHVAPG